MKRTLTAGNLAAFLLAAALLPAGLLPPARAADPPLTPDPDFGGYWHDGQAELDGYRWTGIRYGQERRGQSVMVFVTEPFSESARVKVDDPARHPGDVLDVLKLNHVRDFQTGIYDYNTMVSLFVQSDTFEPVKLSFSSQEWCGNVYDELIFRSKGIEETLHSYFEGESGVRTYPARPGGVSEDNLFILLRGLRGPYLGPGERREVPFFPGVFARRLNHRPGDWTTAVIERRRDRKEITVPAGTFSTLEYRVTTAGGREGRFYVDAAWPHRVVLWSWESTTGDGRRRDASETGELAGFARLKYWELNGAGKESLLEGLGLSPVP
jgi:hypothetical protein